MSQDSLEAKVGPYAPDFRLRATNGREIALTDFRRRMKVVLFFIREYS